VTENAMTTIRKPPKQKATPVRWSVLPMLALTALTSFAYVDEAPAADFLVNNAVYAEGETEPRVRTTTIFLDGLVYDYLESPTETIVFDARAGRFTLLDPDRRVRTEVTTKQVANLITQLKKRAGRHESEYLQFLAEPHFEERFELSTGALVLDSPWLTYRVHTEKPANPDIVEQYRQFADRYCQINTMLNPRLMPPFARMELNRVLAENGVIPRHIELELRSGRGLTARVTRLSSRHELVQKPGEASLARVAQTREFMGMFQLVSFRQYRQPASSD
jgi:hypothetical protein